MMYHVWMLFRNIEPKAIPPVVEAPLFSKTIIRFLSFIFSVKKHISLSDWLSPGATLESALRRPKLNSSLPHIHYLCDLEGIFPW